MNTQWIEFLKTLGGHLDNDEVHFGDVMQEKQKIVENQAIIADLSHLSLIQISGSEAAKFLQGQFTNDVFKVNGNTSQLNAWCTHKGRIIVSFHLFKRGQFYYMLLPQKSVETTLKRLKMYVLRANVILEDVSEQFVVLGFAGANCAEKLSACLNFSLPTENQGCVTENDNTVLTISEKKQHFIFISELESAKNIWQCAHQTLSPVGTSAWKLLNILAELPQITPETAEDFVPQMINWDDLNGVSFQKGCYVGQEVVARVKYRGQIKRRLYTATLDNTATATAQAGDALYADSHKEEIGKIVNIQAHPNGYFLALVSIQTDYAENQEIAIHTVQGNNVQLLAVNTESP